MSDIHDRIFGKLKKLGVIELINAGQESAKSKSSGFMDLNFDLLSVDAPGNTRIALSHYYKGGGDMIADPDMEIRVYTMPGWEKAEALTYQDTYGYKKVYPTPTTVNLKLKKELNDFLVYWLNNCIEQGHKFVIASVEEKEENKFPDDLNEVIEEE